MPTPGRDLGIQKQKQPMEILTVFPQLINMSILQALQIGLNILLIAPFVGAFIYIVTWCKKKAESKK